MKTPLLHLHGVSHRHDDTLLHPLNLAIHDGARHAVIGPDPADRSVLLQLIAGHRTTSSGHIHFDGQPLTGLRPAQRTQLGITYLSPPTRVVSRLTTEQHVSFTVLHHSTPARLRGTRGVDDSRVVRVRAALNQTGLAAHANVPAGQLSDVHARLLALAAALACRPRLLLLDNLSHGLDPPKTRALTRILHQLSRDTALVITDPDATLIAAVADSVTVLRARRRLHAITAYRRTTTTTTAGATRNPAAAAAFTTRPDPAPLLTLHHTGAGNDIPTPIDLSIPRRGVHALLEADGHRRTHLLDVLAGWRTPSDGTVITLDGTSIEPGHRVPAATHGICLAAGHRLNPDHTVGEQLALAQHQHRAAEVHRWNIPNVLAVLPHLTRAGHRYPHQLAPLEQHMLAIGTALLHHPRLLLLNNPGHGLNPHDSSTLATAIAVISRHLSVLIAEPEPNLTHSIATTVRAQHHSATGSHGTTTARTSKTHTEHAHPPGPAAEPSDNRPVRSAAACPSTTEYFEVTP